MSPAGAPRACGQPPTALGIVPCQDQFDPEARPDRAALAGIHAAEARVILESVVTRPLLRAGFFLLWAGYMAWMAIDSSRWFIRWPMVGFTVVALGLSVHFVRVALHQRAN